jgi:hypothetical protein
VEDGGGVTREPFTIPWSTAEVDMLNLYQASPWYHPLTCNGGLLPSQHVHNHEVIMEPTAQGLRCPECGRIQTWLPAGPGELLRLSTAVDEYIDRL